MRKIFTILIFSILLLNVGLVSAHEHFAETKQLIDSGISCDDLSDEQLEAIGEYYMEQMHPGEAHELMDQMMGGEDSESLKQMHINIARNIYCGESGGMMNGGMMSSGGMMGMMQMMGGQNLQSGNMMGNYYSGYNFFGWIFMILIIIVLVLLIIWLIKQIQNSGKRRK